MSSELDERRDNYRGAHRLHPVWSSKIIAVSDDRRAIMSEFVANILFGGPS